MYIDRYRFKYDFNIHKVEKAHGTNLDAVTVRPQTSCCSMHIHIIFTMNNLLSSPQLSRLQTGPIMWGDKMKMVMEGSHTTGSKQGSPGVKLVEGAENTSFLTKWNPFATQSFSIFKSHLSLMGQTQPPDSPEVPPKILSRPLHRIILKLHFAFQGARKRSNRLHSSCH